MTQTKPDIMESINDIRSAVNDLKTAHPEEIERIQEALTDLLHAQILIENLI